MSVSNTQNAKRMATVLKPYVDLLLLATAAAELQRAKCDAIQRRLLGTGKYGGDGNPRTAYLLPDSEASRYFADLDTAYREAGYRDLEPGHCPALIAEHDQTKAEWALIETAEAFFPGVTNDKLLCGIKGLGGLETREKYLNLLIRLVVNHPVNKRQFVRSLFEVRVKQKAAQTYATFTQDERLVVRVGMLPAEKTQKAEAELMAEFTASDETPPDPVELGRLFAVGVMDAANAGPDKLVV